jgi:hypothetical protein
MRIIELRRDYHKKICDQIIRFKPDGHQGRDYPNFADGANAVSVSVATKIAEKFGCPKNFDSISGQTAGDRFEELTREFIENGFGSLNHLRPGKWFYSKNATISDFEQYEHLAYLKEVIARDKKLAAAFKGGYIITPDIVVGRYPVGDEEINANSPIIGKGKSVAYLTPFRQSNRRTLTKILHASISCKWTIRSDRSQNTRTEALNLIRNRKGHLPHVLVVTAEPTASRLSSLALGTGDLDCVYHFALYELLSSTKELNFTDAYDELKMMVDGKRLRDISDLPFDLAL